jgi:hypothetical protein
MPVLGDFLTLVQLAINIGDTTPVPSYSGSLAYSTAINEIVYWDGAAWQHPPGNDYILLQISSSASTLTIGMPVYINQSSNTVDKAVADNSVTNGNYVLGLVLNNTVSVGNVASILAEGKITAPTASWDSITGQSGGLTPGAFYYLSDVTNGGLSTAIPTTSRHWIVRVGQAFTSTMMFVKISPFIQL